MSIEQRILFSKIQPVENMGMLNYMAQQGIPATVCQKYLREIKLYNRQEKKHFITFGMVNEDEGYEVQNEFYSGWINGDRDVSFIRGRQYKARILHVFFHMNDFLAMAASATNHSFIGDAMILHTYDLLHKVPPYLYQYNYRCLYSWMPNNDYGKTALDTLSAYCLAERGLQHKPMNSAFSEYENVNEWCRRERRLKP